ncbi:MAG: CoA transferase [Alphaproteobacteria bacterium]|nr:CoA transferase [Alphaproteobacteria bacterium]
MARARKKTAKKGKRAAKSARTRGRAAPARRRAPAAAPLAAARVRAEAEGRRGPLAGLRVIEIGQMLAGPYVGSRLVDFGAEVIKVEAPDRKDPMRVWGEHKVNGTGLWWSWLSRNKKCVTANLRDPRGVDLIRKLCAQSDVLVENFRPGTLEDWRIGPAELHKINPRLVICRVSGWGQDGPYAQRPGFASVGEAMGGFRYVNGFPGEPPVRMGISLGDSLTGMFATQGVLMALYWRDAMGGGKGQVIDASIIESCFAFMESVVPDYVKFGYVRGPSGTGLSGVVPSNIFKSKEGVWVVIAANVDPMYQRMCKAIARPDLAQYSTHELRAQNRDTIERAISEWAETRTVAEIDTILNDNNVVVGPIYSAAEMVKDPHFKARGMIVPAKDDFYGDIVVPAMTPRFSATPGRMEWLGAPEMGAHNRNVYGGILGLSAAQLAEFKKAGVI